MMSLEKKHQNLGNGGRSCSSLACTQVITHLAMVEIYISNVIPPASPLKVIWTHLNCSLLNLPKRVAFVVE